MAKRFGLCLARGADHDKACPAAARHALVNREVEASLWSIFAPCALRSGKQAVMALQRFSVAEMRLATSRRKNERPPCIDGRCAATAADQRAGACHLYPSIGPPVRFDSQR